MSVIRTVAVSERTRWEAPYYTMPVALNAASLRRLGTLADYKGSERVWYLWSDGELEATDTIVAEDYAPDGPSLLERDANGIRWFRLVRLHAPGTFARLSAPRQTRQPKQPKPGQPVDALALLQLFRRPRREPGGGYVDIRGEAAVALLERAGVVKVGDTFAYLAPGGRPDARVIEGLRRALPLLQGKPCAWCGQEAVTTAVAEPEYLAWCGREWLCGGEDTGGSVGARGVAKDTGGSVRAGGPLAAAAMAARKRLRDG